MEKDDLLDEIDNLNESAENTQSGISQKQALVILAIIVGVMTLAVTIAVLSFFEIVSTRFMMNAGLIFTLIFGICLVTIPNIISKRKQKRCNEPVTVRCIHLNKRLSSGSGDGRHMRTMTYAPVWEYEYNGVKYTYAESVYSNVGVPQVGTEMTAVIDPFNPSELYRPNKSAQLLTLIVGIISIVVGSFGLIIINLLFSLFGAF